MHLLDLAALLCFILTSGHLSGQNSAEESCTIGVAAGSATPDGRPLVWKTRDYASSPDNEVVYCSSFKYKYVGVLDAGDLWTPWMGVNEHGFSIVNANITDLPTNTSGLGNGGLMGHVLGKCRTVAEFMHFLDSTNITGRSTHANYGVIDSTGAAAIFETGGNAYYYYNVADVPEGYIVRTNFSLEGGGTGGMERYKRSSELIKMFASGDSLNHKSILRYQQRDFSDEYSEPVSVPFNDSWSSGKPYGYIYCEKSICRPSSVSATVIHGVKPSEYAGLTTMWTILGQPASSIAIPYWAIGNTPGEADGPVTSSLCDKAAMIRSLLFDYAPDGDYINSYKLIDGTGKGLWPCLFSIEDSVLNNTEAYLDSIRLSSTLPVNHMIAKESAIAARVLASLEICMNRLTTSIEPNKVAGNINVYPNPARDKIYLNYPGEDGMIITIFNPAGTIVLSCRLTGTGPHELDIKSLKSGIYIIVLTGSKGLAETHILVKSPE
jgi:hypothetical protein